MLDVQGLSVLQISVVRTIRVINNFWDENHNLQICVAINFLLQSINVTLLVSYSSHIHFTLLATSAYVLCILGIILMYIWYTPNPTCLLNIFFITWTLVLLQLMTSVSLHPKVSLTIKMLSTFVHQVVVTLIIYSETGWCRLLDSWFYGVVHCVLMLVSHQKVQYSLISLIVKIISVNYKTVFVL